MEKERERKKGGARARHQRTTPASLPEMPAASLRQVLAKKTKSLTTSLGLCKLVCTVRSKKSKSLHLKG